MMSSETTNDDLMSSETTNDDLMSSETTNNDLMSSETTNDDLMSSETTNNDLMSSETTNNDLMSSETTNDDLMSSETTNNDLMSSETTNNDLMSSETTNNDLMSNETTNNDLMSSETRNDDCHDKLYTLSESLRNLQKYNSDSSDSSDSEDDSTDSVDDSESESSDYDSEDEVSTKIGTNISKKNPQPEESWLSVLGVDKVSTELPDISSLDLNDEEQFVHMGNFESIVEKIVTVAALPQMPAYDLDTLLFLEEGAKVLGYIFDVMGPVTAPVYLIPIDNSKSIEDLHLEKGAKVYCAPRSKYTKYVLLQELMQLRGSDASWVGDIEVPPEFQDFSDDEQERNTKANKRKRNQDCDTESEHSMDQLPGGIRSNVQRTGRPSRPQSRNNSPRNSSILNPVAVAARNMHNVPIFNPSVPPPNYRPPTGYAPPAQNMMRPFFPPWGP